MHIYKFNLKIKSDILHYLKKFFLNSFNNDYINVNSKQIIITNHKKTSLHIYLEISEILNELEMVTF